MKTGFIMAKHLLADIDAAIIIAMTGLLIRNLTKKYKEKEASTNYFLFFVHKILFVYK